MDDKVFQACLRKFNKEKESSWDSLASLYNYQSGEILRCAFKRARKKLGITKDNKQAIKSLKFEAPRILIFDIENSYIEIASWGINKQYINKTQILHDWFMLSYSAKILYDSEIISGALTPIEAKNKDDKRIVGELRDLLNSCDIAITYNGNFYDIPKINTRMIVNGFFPPSFYKSIDVYQTISKNFSFSSKGMDFVNYRLELERKKENEGMSLWIDCVNGKEEALKKMEEYNRQDVVALQETYIKIRPWIKGHPNIGLWHNSEDPICGFCGSINLEYIDKLYSTPTGLYKSFRCKICGGLGRTKENTISKNKRKNNIRNI